MPHSALSVQHIRAARTDEREVRRFRVCDGRSYKSISFYKYSDLPCISSFHIVNYGPSATPAPNKTIFIHFTTPKTHNLKNPLFFKTTFLEIAYSENLKIHFLLRKQPERYRKHTELIAEDPTILKQIKLLNKIKKLNQKTNGSLTLSSNKRASFFALR